MLSSEILKSRFRNRGNATGCDIIDIVSTQKSMSENNKIAKTEYKLAKTISRADFVVVSTLSCLAVMILYFAPGTLNSIPKSVAPSAIQYYLLFIGLFFMFQLAILVHIVRDRKRDNQISFKHLSSSNSPLDPLDHNLAYLFARLNNQKWSIGLIAVFVCICFALLGLFWS